MRPVADTSFLIAVVDAVDPHHADARRLLGGNPAPAIGRECLAELLHVAQFKARKAQGATAGLQATRAVVEAVLDELGCPIEPELDTNAVRELFSTERKISWVDAAVLVQAKGRELWTFDKHQQAIHAKG